MALHSDLAMPTGTRSVPTKRAAAMRRWPGHGHEAKMAQNQNECRWVGSMDHDKGEWKMVENRILEGSNNSCEALPVSPVSSAPQVGGVLRDGLSWITHTKPIFRRWICAICRPEIYLFAPKNRCPKMGLDHLPFPSIFHGLWNRPRLYQEDLRLANSPFQGTWNWILLEFLLFFLTGVLYVV